MQSAQVLESIIQTAARVLPKGSSLYLYGSRARGDARADSDWDLLVLLNKPEVSWKEREEIESPFVETGWDIGADISARAFTQKQWQREGPHSLFYFNVEEDKKLLYES